MSQIQILTIDPKYLELIPRPSKERYNEIKKDIFHKGQLIAIIVNQDNVIIDGYTRYQICKELQIKPKIEKRIFESKLEEERFVYSINLKRRDLEKFVQIELSIKLHDIDIIIAKKNQSKGGKGFQIPEKDKQNTTKKIAKEINTSSDTVSKVKKITHYATQKEIQDLRKGRDGISINKVFRKIKIQEKKQKRQEEIKKIQIKLPESIQLFNEAFQQNKIPNNSVSLIFTDPPYGQESLHIIQDLMYKSMQVLKVGGSLLFYPGHAHIDKVFEYAKNAGLTYNWIIAVIHSGNSASNHNRHVIIGYKPMLWFTKGKYNGSYVSDIVKSKFQGKELHKWAQSTVESDYYIKYLTIENEIVYDPFLGQGTFGISAIKLKRQFIGSEIDKVHFKTAQKLLTIQNLKNKKQGDKK